MFGQYFEYNGHKSTDFGLMIGGLNMSTDIPFAMARDTYVGALNRYKNKVNHMGTKWSGVLQFTLSFVKDTCTSPNDMFFTEEEVNTINSWLTSPDFPLLFHMYDEDFSISSAYDSIYLHKDALLNNNVLELYLLSNLYYVIVFNKDGEITGTEVIDPYTDYDIVDGQIETYDVAYEADISGNIPDYSDVIVPSKHDAPIRIDVEDKYIRLVFAHDSNAFITGSCKLNNISLSSSSSAYWSYASDNTYKLMINSEITHNRIYDYFGVFTDVTAQVVDGDVIGFNATFTTNSPFAWTKEINVPVSGETTWTVNSAEQEREIYPLIEIWCKSGAASRETITISNLRDTSTTVESVDGHNQTVEVPRTLTLEVPHMPVYIDCERGRIYDVLTTSSGYINHILDFEDLGLEDLSHIYWPRLFNGENTWQITSTTSDYTVTVKYREPRKVGAY